MAVSRLDGRLLEGLEMKVNWARYDRVNKVIQKAMDIDRRKPKQQTSKAWRESFRDQRYFKEIVVHAITTIHG